VEVSTESERIEVDDTAYSLKQTLDVLWADPTTESDRYCLVVEGKDVTCRGNKGATLLLIEILTATCHSGSVVVPCGSEAYC